MGTNSSVTSETSATPLFPNEPKLRWELPDIDKLVLWGAEIGMSDLWLVSNQVVWIRLHGKWIAVTKRRIAANELFSLVEKMSNNMSAATALRSKAMDLDFAYEVLPARGERLRFRANACAIANGRELGIKIALRVIPGMPPLLESMNLESGITDCLFPENGLVVVTGVMGSGKTTLLAAVMREIIEKGGRSVNTYENPIEFSFDNIPQHNGPITQSQIPQHLESFPIAVRNSTRTAPNVVLIGEARDFETLKGMIEAAELGVATYATVHTKSVPETISRIINAFSVDEQNQVLSTLLASLRLIVHQRLIPKIGGGRVAVREFLPFTPDIREALLECPKEAIIRRCESLLFELGQPLQHAAQRLFDDGLIERVEYLAIMKEREKNDGKLLKEPSSLKLKRPLFVPPKRLHNSRKPFVLIRGKAYAYQ